VAHTDYSNFMTELGNGNEEYKHLRTIAKMANFGLGGGMAATRFHRDCNDKGVEISPAEAAKVCRGWLKQWPEMIAYRRGAEQAEAVLGYVKLVGTGQRVRGDITYTSANNYHFQGTVADGCKAALFALQGLCYCLDTSARVVAFIHDEIIFEVPLETAPEFAAMASEMMVNKMKAHLPGIEVVKAEPRLMRRWSKDPKDELRCLERKEDQPPKSSPNHLKLSPPQHLKPQKKNGQQRVYPTL